MKHSEISHQIPYLRLGVNIDHVATIRNARGGEHPDTLRAAHIAVDAGADGITAHLREDRRHISDKDIARLKSELTRPLNLEMAPTEEMVSIAKRHLPHACCLVPERREERTTEGGLNVLKGGEELQRVVDNLKDCNIRVSLFIEPDARQIEAAKTIRADIVELHTGAYCETALKGEPLSIEREIKKLKAAAALAQKEGLEVHAGHGLTYNTVARVSEMPEIVELNIGHFLIGEAIFGGLHSAIQHMRFLMNNARYMHTKHHTRTVDKKN